MPTIYLSNWSSHRTPGHHGPGRKLTIMARPRRLEHGEGRVPALTPDPLDLVDVKAGRLPVSAYRERFLAAHGAKDHTPGELTAALPEVSRPVADGDTLCCSCSRAEAAAGRCHRVWAAELLQAAGWRVVLDGVSR